MYIFLNAEQSRSIITETVKMEKRIISSDMPQRYETQY